MSENITGQINEIFKSLQGEGPYLGAEQIFVRFAGCNLACKFCDTKDLSSYDYSLEAILKEIENLPGSNFVSITGGEPLLQVDFLGLLLKELKVRKFKVYLETNGTLVDGLSRVIDFVDIVAMDFKLPSSTGLKSYFDEHNEFLKISRIKEVFIKAIITESTCYEDVKNAVRIIGCQDKDILLVLQPDTNQLSQELFKKISDLRSLALEYLSNVRIMPQVHKILGVR